MYFLNGIDLDSEPYSVQIETDVWGRLSFRSSSFDVPGMPGLVPVPPVADGRVMKLTVRSTAAAADALGAMLANGIGVLQKGDRQASIEILGMTPDIPGLVDDVVDFEISYRINGVYWRSATEVDFSAPLNATLKSFTPFPNSQVPMGDAVLRFAGQIAGLSVAGTGAYKFSYSGTIPAGSFLRFDAATGRAWTTTTDTWTGGTEVTHLIINGTGPNFFEFTKAIQVSATSAGATSAVAVRGREAFF